MRYRLLAAEKREKSHGIFLLILNIILSDQPY